MKAQNRGIPAQVQAGGGGAAGSQPPEQPGGGGVPPGAPPKGTPLGGFSEHPDDTLVRELIQTGREPTPDEVQRIVHHVASAGFNSQLVRVRPEHQGLLYQGTVLGARATSLEYHIVERVVVYEQWAYGTAAGQFVDDLHRLVAHPSTQIVLHRRMAGWSMVGFLGRTGSVVPADRRGAQARDLLWVDYSGDRGIIVTGFMVAHPADPDYGRVVRWIQ